MEMSFRTSFATLIDYWLVFKAHLLSLKVCNLLDEYETGVLQNGAKMVVLMEIIEKSVQLGDKILVFRWDFTLKKIDMSFLKLLKQHSGCV